MEYEPVVKPQWLKKLQEFVKLDIMGAYATAVDKAYKILLAGFAIGFTFLTYLILVGTYPGLDIAIVATGVVLWISLEFIYRDPIFVFSGVVYLISVAGTCTAEIAIGTPPGYTSGYILISTMGTPTMYLLGLLVAMRLSKWLLELCVQFMFWLFSKKSMAYLRAKWRGDKQHTPAQNEKKATTALVKVEPTSKAVPH